LFCLTEKQEPLPPARAFRILAGAIAPATAPRCPLSGRGPKAPGQRPPRPRRALPARRVGRWPVGVPGSAGLRGTVARGRGKRGSRFLIPPKGAIPFPGPGRVSRQAGGRVVVSAPCQGL